MTHLDLLRRSSLILPTFLALRSDAQRSFRRTHSGKEPDSGAFCDEHDGRADLGSALAYSGRHKSGRSLFNPGLMFKTLVIQMLNNLFSGWTEDPINDNLSFIRRFLFLTRISVPT